MLSIQIKKEIKEHALRTKPFECNGLILFNNNCYQVFRCKNLSYYPEDHAILSPLDYVMAEKQGKIVGYYHSQESDSPSLIDNYTAYYHNIYSIVYCLGSDKFYVIEPELKDFLNKDFNIGVNDCFSLVKNYYKNKLNIYINNYNRGEDWYIKTPKIIISNFEKEGFKRIKMEDIKENDIILFGEEDDISHLGIYLRNDMLLHHPRGAKSCIEHLNHLYKSKISLIVRHNSYE